MASYIIGILRFFTGREFNVNVWYLVSIKGGVGYVNMMIYHFGSRQIRKIQGVLASIDGNYPFYNNTK